MADRKDININIYWILILKYRLCSLTLIRLTVMRPLPTSEVSSVIVAVKMAGSRRTLRSNEIPLTDNGLISTDLELHFSLQVKRMNSSVVITA